MLGPHESRRPIESLTGQRVYVSQVGERELPITTRDFPNTRPSRGMGVLSMGGTCRDRSANVEPPRRSFEQRETQHSGAL